ncbi:MAG: acyltransferase family protein [Akkermansia sp.]|nr:acyltransferase family protein [Akkermansia sp.]
MIELLFYGFRKRILATMQPHSHKTYIDVLRIFAILLVVFNHTPAFHFPFQSTGESLLVKVMLVISSFDKVAVPLFFMISGALLLPKSESIRIVISKRVVRFLIIIFLFHLVQSIYYLYSGGENGIGIRSFLSDCYWGNTDCGYVLGWTGAAAVWFLYAYVGLLLMLPFLRSMVSGMENIHFIYLFGLQMVFCVICPAVFVLVTGRTPEGFALLKYLPLCGNVLVFVFAGYYAEHKVCVKKMEFRHFLLLLVVSCFFVLLASLMPEWARSRMNAETVSQSLPGIKSYLLIPCITIYLISKRIAVDFRVNERFARRLQTLGGAVFTVMLVENILRKEMSDWFAEYNSAYLPSVWVSCLVCLVGLTLGMVCKNIPWLKKLL